jgi:hypothetical protein
MSRGLEKNLREYRGRGPRTAEGLARIVKANWKHGRRSRSAMREAAELRAFLRSCRETIAQAHGNATPTSPRKAAPVKRFLTPVHEDCPKN